VDGRVLLRSSHADEGFRLASLFAVASSRPAASEERGLRTDAERNRSRIIEAAREIFAEQGIDVPMHDVAHRAGVGVGTLYRRFPTRGDLIAGAFADQMAAFADGVQAALADPDPWHGFCAYIERLCAVQATNRGFCDVLTMTFPSFRTFETARRQIYEGFTELTGRAKASGALRADFVAEDLPILLMANAGVVAAAGDEAPQAPARLIGYLLQAFAAPGRESLPPPPSMQQMYHALVRMGEERSAADPLP
jgi:AcrR family transcriptional regulator